MTTIAPAAFDALAATYDADFTRTTLGQMLRQRVWAVLGRYFSGGQHILELACGTGEDALWLAQHGLRVTATDGSIAMLRLARQKAIAAGQVNRVLCVPLSLQAIAAGPLPFPVGSPLFDGVLSNFGGLNTIDQWRPLAERLSMLVKPGGVVVLVPMGAWCPWEIGWHGLRGHGRIATRRWRGSASARIGGAIIPVHYPSPRRLRVDFSPWFRLAHTESLGLWLPPSYLGHLVERRPGLFRRLNWLEQVTSPLTCGWGDHYIVVFIRQAESSDAHSV